MKTWVGLGLLVLTSALQAQTPLTVTGVSDRSNVSTPVTVNVPAEAGYTYAIYLNATNVASGGSYTIRDPDFYLLQVFRTNTTTLDVTNRLFRFIIRNSARGDTEDGLPTHTPLLAIPSSSNEFAGGRLRIIAPAAFPTGYEIPVVAWAVNGDDRALRANGRLESPGHPSILLRRGVGSGFLSANHPAGALDYAATLKGIQTNKTIHLQGGTVWTPVSGTLSGSTVWPADSRIHVQGSITIPAGSSLSIGEGSIVRLNASADITNNGLVTINGTIQEPVVFMPNTRAQRWGGFIMRAGTGAIEATGTIFTGSGANQNWFGQNGNPGSHRAEQALFYIGDNQSVTLTDCAAIQLGGQFGKGRTSGTLTLTRVLMQNGTSGGEYSGTTLRVNDSAFIEFPNDTSNFENADHDALYLVSGNQGFTNTLFGWTKDDGIDSGGSGYGTIVYESCWFESTFHEANSLSGYKNVFPRNTVYLDCGQGHEDGYDSPTGRVDRCLFIGNKSGLRHGDNYSSFSGYRGLLTSTNSVLLFNHRDVFGYNWDSEGGWTNNSGQMDIRGNWLTKPDTNFPDNTVWDPVNDGWRLSAFSTAPVNIVGIGMALRSGQVAAADLTNGIPVRLSTFCTNFVSVDYTIETPETELASGTLQFVPGEIVKRVRIAAAALPGGSLVRVQLSNPVNAEITEQRTAFLGGSTPPLIAYGSVWKYPNVAGAQAATWRNLDFNDAAWLAGPAQLGFSNGEEDDEATLISNLNQLTYYFRRVFTVDDPSAYTNLMLRVIRDDAAVVHLNGTEVYRSPNLPAFPIVITFTTASGSPNGENTLDTSTVSREALVPGQNVAAVEIHQQSTGSSDVSFDLQLEGNPLPRVQLVRFGADWLLMWGDATFALEEASEITGPWTRVNVNSPVTLSLNAASRFYRLAK